MLIYWMMFALPVLAGISPIRPDPVARRLGYVLAFVLLTAVIGGRDVVGCDWDAYLGHYYAASGRSLPETAQQSYPGYVLLNWAATRLGLSVHAVNTACAAIFAYGLLAFASRQPRPWLVVAAAMPYLVIVVSMGFTRQATAIGLLMLAFNAFSDRRLVRFLVFVGLAGLFHNSAVALAPMAVLIRRDQPLSPWIIGGAATAFLVLNILSNSLDRYVYAYIESEYHGEGALYRLPLNAAAGLAVLMFHKRWLARFDDGRLFIILALAALVVLPFAYFLPVMADRMSMYLLPFQAAVAARMPELMPRRQRGITAIAVVAAYAASLYVWLNYANHADCWVPYASVYF